MIRCARMGVGFGGSVAAIALVMGGMQAPTEVAIVPAEVVGDAPELGAELAKEAVAAVDGIGGTVVQLPPGCADVTCASEAAGAHGYVISVRVEVVVSDFVIETRVVDGHGETVAESSERCDICRQDEAAAVAGVAMTGALKPFAAVADEQAPIPQKQRDDRRMPVREKLGWGAVGVGAGLLVGGIALLVLNDRPVQNDCSGANVDAMGNCKLLWNTLGAGIGLTLSGAAVAGVGAGLVVQSRKKNGKARLNASFAPGRLMVQF